MLVGILGMAAAIAIMIIGAYRGLKSIPLTLLAGFVVMITNGLPIWTSLSTVYAPGFGNVIASYFFIFVASAIYAIVMEKTGCAAAIGYKFIDWFGTKNVVMVGILFVGLLTYGGVNLFVVIYATLPILFIMLREANLPRHLTILCLGVGSSTITMTTLPGTPALTNVIPGQFLGTPLTSAPVFSLILAAMFFGLCVVYINFAVKDARNKGEVWTYPEGYDKSLLEIDRSQLPPAHVALTPIIVLIVFILASSFLRDTLNLGYAKDAGLLATLAMCIATVLCILLNWGKIKEIGGMGALKEMFGEGSLNGISAIIGLASVVAFGTLVSASHAFQDVVAFAMSLELSPYYKGVVATSIVSLITGSSSGGVRIALSNISEYLLSSGANMEVMHRCMAMAADSLDSLPHAGGIFLMFSLVGVTHKEAYKHGWWTTCVIPTIMVIIAAVAATILWPAV